MAEKDPPSKMQETAAHPCHACIVKPVHSLKTVWTRLKPLWSRVFALLPSRVQAFLVRHPWKITIGLVIFLLLSYGYNRLTREPEPEYITAQATRGTLIQTVEAVGTVISDRDLRLQFPVSGVVAEVLVVEGDKVEAGQKLAVLRAYDLAASVDSAYAGLQVAQADLQELQEGSRPEDIAIAEAEVENKRASLHAARGTLAASEQKLVVLQKEADVGLAAEVAKTESIYSQQLTVARTALTVIDDVLDDNDVHDALTRNQPGIKTLIRGQKEDVAVAVNALLMQTGRFEDYQEALNKLKSARFAVVDAGGIVVDLFDIVVSAAPTSSFTRSERETRKKDLSTEKKSIQTALSAIDTALENLLDESAAYDTKIAAEETTIASAKGDTLTLETSLRTEEAQLALEKAGARQTDINAAAARVRQARADLAAARADFDDTILYTPVDGP